MRKLPTRARGEISQSYNDGVVYIYRAKNDAAPGDTPHKKLVRKGQLNFENRTVGMARFYTAMQAGIKISRVLRVPQGFEVSAQDVAVLLGDKTQYSIVQVQATQDVWPASLDLTLEEVVRKYDFT